MSAREEARANGITLAVSPSAEDLSELCSKAQRMEELLAAAAQLAEELGSMQVGVVVSPHTERGGKVLKEKRRAAGMTVKALSELSGVPKRTIQNWESQGVGHASVENLLKVARALGTTLDELAGAQR